MTEEIANKTKADGCEDYIRIGCNEGNYKVIHK